MERKALRVLAYFQGCEIAVVPLNCKYGQMPSVPPVCLSRRDIVSFAAGDGSKVCFVKHFFISSSGDSSMSYVTVRDLGTLLPLPPCFGLAGNK